MITIAYICAILTTLSAMLIIWNLYLFDDLTIGKRPSSQPVSVLIPARDEADNIEAAINSVRSNQHVEFEIIIGNDGSTDGTREIVNELAADDDRIKIIDVPEIPEGWTGKQHVCHVISKSASYPYLLFMDADVRLSANALTLMVSKMKHESIHLLSGFPFQVTQTFAEKLIIPLIHFLLLGYLPIWFMRFTRFSAFGAGCGQLIAVNRQAYIDSGGHSSIASSSHDGLKLPRYFRTKGYRTEIFDAKTHASCRMYRSWSEIWLGFSKNATEGMATTAALPIWTVLLFGGHALPALLAVFYLISFPSSQLLACFVLVTLCSIAQRLALANRFRQSYLSALCHPLGIIIILCIQFSAYYNAIRGHTVRWRGRAYQPKG